MENKKVIAFERCDGKVAVAVTDGSVNFHDAFLVTTADIKDGDSRVDILETALFYAAKRIIQLEKGGYTLPPEGKAMASGGIGIPVVGGD